MSDLSGCTHECVAQLTRDTNQTSTTDQRSRCETSEILDTECSRSSDAFCLLRMYTALLRHCRAKILVRTSTGRRLEFRCGGICCFVSNTENLVCIFERYYQLSFRLSDWLGGHLGLLGCLA